MDLHIQYSTPVKTDICVAFCFFNPCGYVRPLQNLTFFEHKLRLAKIPYYSIEMVIGDKPPMVANPTVRVKSKSSLFYKEALWNRLEREIPPKYTKIAFIDSDVIFSEANWLDKLSTLLDSCDLVHPFETVDRLDLSYKKVDTLISSLKNNNTSGSGMGWAITRECFRKINGFFENGILGNGDTLFYDCIRENINENDNQYLLIKDSFMAYRSNFMKVSPTVTYLDMHIFHLSHGTIKNRQYGSRHTEILGKINATWDTLFSVNSDGFWELNDDSLDKKMIDYFTSRKEDSQEVDKIEDESKKLPVTVATIMNTPRPAFIQQIPIQNKPNIPLVNRPQNIPRPQVPSLAPRVLIARTNSLKRGF